MRKFLILTLSLLFSCASTHSYHENISIAGDQKNTIFKDLKKQGYTKVINLRQAGEDNYSHADALKEEKAVRDAGLEYVSVALPRQQVMSQNVDPNVLKGIDREVANVGKDERILVHCSSGSRAALWYGQYIYNAGNVTKEEAVKIAKENGLKDVNALKALEKILDEK